MKIKRTIYENFGPFARAEMSFDSLGLVLVQGDNRVSSSADSNGSGKSYLLEGPVWCLFGRTMRGVDADRVVNRKAGKNCMVRTEIDNGGQEVVVTRYRKHKTGKNGVTVEVDGVDRTLGTNKETDKFIAELLGLDFNAFIRSVYFDGANIVPFPTLTDKEIKETFEKILGLEDLSKVADAVKKRLSAERSAIGVLDSEIAFARSNLSTAEVEVLAARDRVTNHAAAVEAEVKRIEGEIADLDAQLRALRDDVALDAEEAALRAHEKALKDQLATLDGADQVIAANAQAANATLAQIAQKKADLEKVLALIESLRVGVGVTPPAELAQERMRISLEIARLESEIAAQDAASRDAAALIGTNCRECGKPYHQEDLQTIISRATESAARLRGEHAQASARLDATDRKIRDWMNGQIVEQRLEAERLKGQIAGLEATLAELQDKSAKLSTLAAKRASIATELQGMPLRYRTISDARQHNAHLRRSRSDLESRITSLRRSVNPHQADLERWQKRRDDCAAEIATKEAERAAKQGKVLELEVLERAYGRTGLKAHILETITPILNVRANQYATNLADGAVKIHFSTVSRNKDGSLSERFSVNVVNDEGAEGYLGNSTGERKKIDLAIALALSDLVAARASKPIDLWVADEIAESLDPTALERVVDLLRTKAAERGTLLTISHTDMRAWIPNVVTVRKTPAGSELVI